MLRPLSLRARLLALLGAALAAGLCVGVGLLMLHAAQRVRAESDSTARLAREFAATALASLHDSEDPVAALRGLLAEVDRLRHIRIYMADAGAPEAVEQPRRAPAWFAALVAAPPSVTRMTLGPGRPGGELVLAADPGDEIDEIWSEVAALALGALGLALAGFAIVSLAVGRALSPVAALGEALERLRGGERALRVPVGGAPEFVAIAERIEQLAATLARLDEENRALIERLLHVQDEERRDIARDLHDEIGPFLFAIRARLGALARRLDGDRRDDCARIEEQIAALQQVNRRILGRLRPAALEEMGLAGALEALAQGWREQRPEVAIRLLCSAAAPLDETTALTAYRIAQEGLTNVFRHARATRVDVTVETASSDGLPELRVAIRDDGAGLDAAAPQGMGLRGMGERVAALGGRLTIRSAPPRGALLEARLPLAAREPA
jgi:two-component system sensor histidine kinase UhpB